VIGAGAGSLFVFKGKYKAVLISYPDHDSKDIMQIFK
jgi:cyclase